MAKGFVGMKANMGHADIITLTLSVNQTVKAGDALEYTGERTCKKFVGGRFAGFAVADSLKDEWKQYESISVMQKGSIFVDAAAAATVNSPVGLSSTGTIADAAKTTYPNQIANSRFVEAVTSGIVEIEFSGTDTTVITA